MKECFIIGGGSSVREGIDKGLWDKIKGKDIWSLNYAFKFMPYLPTRQLWVDIKFFKDNIDDLQKLQESGVFLFTTEHKDYSGHRELNRFKEYCKTRERTGHKGRETFKSTYAPPHLFVGKMGLSGTFSLSLAIAEEYDRIWLLGYDFGNNSKENKTTHWYQGQAPVKSTGVGNPSIYRDKNDKVKSEEVEDYQVFKKDPVQIINVSPNSNIPYFEKSSYDEMFIRIANG